MLRFICLFSILLAISAAAQTDSLKVDTTITESALIEQKQAELLIDTVLYQRKVGLDQFLSADDTTNLEMHLYQNPTFALFKSALIPGWGQFGNRKYIKATIFAGLSAWMVSSAFHYGSQASDFKARFDAETSVDARNELYGLFNDRRDARNKFTWYAGIIAFISMFDAYVDAHMSGFPDKERAKDISFDFVPNHDGRVQATLHYSF